MYVYINDLFSLLQRFLGMANSRRCLRGEFTLKLFNLRLVTEAGKFGLPIDQMSESTNRQPEFYDFQKYSYLHERYGMC